MNISLLLSHFTFVQRLFMIMSAKTEEKNRITGIFTSPISKINDTANNKDVTTVLYSTIFGVLIFFIYKILKIKCSFNLIYVIEFFP